MKTTYYYYVDKKGNLKTTILISKDLSTKISNNLFDSFLMGKVKLVQSDKTHYTYQINKTIIMCIK